MPLTTTEKRDFRKYILSQLETTRIQALEHPRMRNYSRFSKVETTTDWEIAELCKLVLGEELYGSVSRFAHVNNVYTRLVEEGHIYFDAPPDMDEFLAGGGNIEYIPRGKHTIDAKTNKPFMRPYSQRVRK